jgi:hypothetical protein
MKILSLAIALLTLTVGIASLSVVNAQTLQKGTSPTIQIEVDRKVMEVVKSWDKRICLFTSKDNPLKSFDGLQQKDIAAWGAELMEQVQAFYKVIAITDKRVRIIGTGNPIFSGMKNPPRLFITWLDYESELPGAITIELKEKQTNTEIKVQDAKKKSKRSELPSPQAGRGHAHGIMLLKGKPQKGIPIYLHRINPNELGLDPVAHTDEHGSWMALNIKPGEYITTAFRPDGALAYSLDSVREVKEGGVTDFGKRTTYGADGF